MRINYSEGYYGRSWSIMAESRSGLTGYAVACLAAKPTQKAFRKFKQAAHKALGGAV